MRVGLVIDRFDPLRGGAEQWTYQLARRLLADGHEVHVVAQRFSPAGRQLSIVPHELGRIRCRLRAAAAAERSLRELALEVIHDMGLGWFCDVLEPHYGSWLAQSERKLRLLPPWARPWKRRLMRLLPRYRAMQRLAARQFGDPQRVIIALSKMATTDYQRYHAVRQEQIRLIYNGVDTERFSPAHRVRYRQAVRAALGIEKPETAFLFVGHNFALKGLGAAIRALGRLVSEGRPARLIAVGGRPDPAYERLARRHCGAGRVALVGRVEDPVPYYAAADALVLPTFSDTCSLVVLEAAASGLPSITTQFNGAAELLTNRIDGFVLADPADDKQLADRMRELLDPVLRHKMGHAARHLACQHTFEQNYCQVLAVYEHLRRRCRRAAGRDSPAGRNRGKAVAEAVPIPGRLAAAV
ncbi:MAG: glycosyltransferase family 4 protein [Thermoguttaceae bacterium]